MAQSITSASAGRVNRRFLLLALILASLSAVLVYTALSNTSDSGGGGPSATTVPVVVANVTIPAGTTITGDMLKLANIPEEFIGEGAFASIDSTAGQVARYPIAINQQVLISDVVGSPTAASNDVLRNIIVGGERGMAIRVEAVVGAGGLVLPGDYADVWWVPDDPEDDVTNAQLIAEDVQVLSVEQTLVEVPPIAPGLQEDGQEAPPANEPRVPGIEGEPIPEAATVTLMLTSLEAQRVFCGEEGGTLRLAVRAFGDHSPAGMPVIDCIILGKQT